MDLGSILDAILELPFWQKLYLLTFIVGCGVFTELIGWITDEVKADFKNGVYSNIIPSVKADWARSMQILKGDRR